MSLASYIAGRSARERGILAWGIAAAFAYVLLVLTVEPLRWLASEQATWRSSAEEELRHARGRLLWEPELRTRLKQLPTEKIWSKLYKASDGEPLTRVQQDVSELIASSGASPQTLEPIGRIQQGALVAHGVRVRAPLTIDQLEIFLGKLKAHAKYLRVAHLKISAPQTQTPESNASLQVTLQIFGYSTGQPAKERS